jgi:hypothetical protein
VLALEGSLAAKKKIGRSQKSLEFENPTIFEILEVSKMTNPKKRYSV